jgi:hypothetical protein
MDEASLKRLKDHMGFDAWCGRTNLKEALFVKNYFIGSKTIPTLQLHRQVPTSVEGIPHSIHSIWRSPDGDPEALLRYDVYECDSHLASHEFLVRYYGQFQSADVHRQDDIRVGDIAFMSQGGQALVFVRANLMIFLASAGHTYAPIVDIARCLDATLTDKPIISAEVASRTVARLSVAQATLQKGEETPIQLEMERAVVQPHYYKYFCSTGEIFIKQGQLTYHATIEGNPLINAYVIEETGCTAHQQLRIAVSP